MSGTASWRNDPRFGKECGCEVHTVPHWLWLDRMDRARTGESVERMRQRLAEYVAAPSYLTRSALWTSIFAVAAVDLPRVREKLATMRRLGIDALPDDLGSQLEAEWAARIPPPPEPIPPPSVEILREQLREAALSAEMAANAKEKERLLARMVELDGLLRAARA